MSDDERRIDSYHLASAGDPVSAILDHECGYHGVTTVGRLREDLTVEISEDCPGCGEPIARDEGFDFGTLEDCRLSVEYEEIDSPR